MTNINKGNPQGRPERTRKEMAEGKKGNGGYRQIKRNLAERADTDVIWSRTRESAAIRRILADGDLAANLIGQGRNYEFKDVEPALMDFYRDAIQNFSNAAALLHASMNIFGRKDNLRRYKAPEGYDTPGNAMLTSLMQSALEKKGLSKETISKLCGKLANYYNEKGASIDQG